MPRQYIRRQTLNALREFLVGFGTLRTIREELDTAGIELIDVPIPNVSGQRRTLIEQYYKSLNLSKWEDVQKILEVFEAQLMWLKTTNQTEHMDRLLKPLEQDGFTYVDNCLHYVRADLPSLTAAQKIVDHFNLKYMARQIQRCNDFCETDPDSAVGAAKELIESCCKTILGERQIQFEEKSEITELVKATTKELKLNRDDIPDAVKGAEIVKRTLSNLASISQGITELRNLYGTGHGKDGRASSIKPRHAKLAVGAATTLVVFLYETHLEQKTNPPNL